MAISVGSDHAVGLHSDGTVEAVGYGARSELAAWRNIIAVSAGTHFPLGLKADGTVVVDNPKVIGLDGVWSDIKVPA